MSADLDDHDSWLVLEGESRDIVLRVERVGDAEVRVEGFKLWFSYGEPAFVQSIPLTAEWGQGCIAELAG